MFHWNTKTSFLYFPSRHLTCTGRSPRNPLCFPENCFNSPMFFLRLLHPLTHTPWSTPMLYPCIFNTFDNRRHHTRAAPRNQFSSQSRLVGGWWVEARVLAPGWGWLRRRPAGEGVPLYSSCKLVAPVWRSRRLARWRNLLCSRTASCASWETRGCNPFPLPPHTPLLPDFFQCLHINNWSKILFLRNTQTLLGSNPFSSRLTSDNTVYIALGIEDNSF